jgi:hypothetical protein
MPRNINKLPEPFDIVIEGLLLINDFLRPVNRKVIFDCLTKPIIVTDLHFTPDWNYVQSYIQKHHELLYLPHLQEAWEKRNQAAIYQVKLINCFMDALRGKTYRKIFAFADKISETSEPGRLVIQNVDTIVEIINNEKLTRQQKKKKLIALFKKE